MNRLNKSFALIIMFGIFVSMIVDSALGQGSHSCVTNSYKAIAEIGLHPVSTRDGLFVYCPVLYNVDSIKIVGEPTNQLDFMEFYGIQELANGKTSRDTDPIRYLFQYDHGYADTIWIECTLLDDHSHVKAHAVIGSDFCNSNPEVVARLVKTIEMWLEYEMWRR